AHAGAAGAASARGIRGRHDGCRAPRGEWGSRLLVHGQLRTKLGDGLMQADILVAAIRLAQSRFNRPWHKLSHEERRVCLVEIEAQMPLADPVKRCQPPWKDETPASARALAGGLRK